MLALGFAGMPAHQNEAAPGSRLRAGATVRGDEQVEPLDRREPTHIQEHHTRGDTLGVCRGVARAARGRLRQPAARLLGERPTPERPAVDRLWRELLRIDPARNRDEAL